MSHFEPVGPMCVLPARGHAHLRTSWSNVCVACSGSRTPSNQLDQCVCCLLGVTHTFEPVGPMCVLPARGHAHLRTSWTNVCVACSGSRTPSNQLDQCVCCLLGVTHTFEPVGPMCVLPARGHAHLRTSWSNVCVACQSARGHAHLRTSWTNVCVACSGSRTPSNQLVQCVCCLSVCSGSRTPSNQLVQCVCCLLGVTHTFEPVGPMCVLPARGHAHLRTSWSNVCVLPARGHAHLRTSWTNVCVACQSARGHAHLNFSVASLSSNHCREFSTQ